MERQQQQQHLFRSLIFVPGNNPRFLEKARGLQADIVCFDLEDSVPGSEKANARGLVAGALDSRQEGERPPPSPQSPPTPTPTPSFFVRTNPPASGEISADLEAVVREGIDGIVVPKVNNVGDLRRVEGILSGLEEGRGLGPVQVIPSIESAEGVVNAYGIASSGKRVCALVFGVFDLLNDLGVEYTKESPGARYSREKVPLDARAAGIPAIDAIWQDLKDLGGLESDCRVGKGLGYSGKSIIHPDQIPVVHRLFHPNKSEILRAERTCEAYLLSLKTGKGATTVDGKMIDKAHYKQARALLDLAGRQQQQQQR